MINILADAAGVPVVHGACPHDCPDTCAMLTTVEIRICARVRGDTDRPTTQGTLCTKVSRPPERTYGPNRVLHPMTRCRPKGPGQGSSIQISWGLALDDEVVPTLHVSVQPTHRSFART